MPVLLMVCGEPNGALSLALDEILRTKITFWIGILQLTRTVSRKPKGKAGTFRDCPKAVDLDGFCLCFHFWQVAGALVKIIPKLLGNISLGIDCGTSSSPPIPHVPYRRPLCVNLLTYKRKGKPGGSRLLSAVGCAVRKAAVP